MRVRSNGATTTANVITKELPQQFVDSLRVLFDILDTSRTGLVSFEHLAGKWRQLPTRGLPPNFLDCLRHVTPPNGLLDFARFLAGVRLSLNERNACAPYQRASNQGKLQRVRSEGKLHDISNNSNWREFTKNGDAGTMNSGPTMGVNMLFPSAKSNAFGMTQIQRRKEYRSQPDISTKGFDRFAGNSKENYAESSNYGIVMRPKKNKSTRAPLPPQAGSTPARVSCVGCFASPSSATSSSTAGDPATTPVFNNRPNSINSAVSGSSGFSELQSATSCGPTKSATPYAEELRPQVAKHERLLAEEWAVVCKGADTTRRLQRWFQERVDSLEKRKSMLERGMVALDSAVHEQKLNFYRAQISELTRRMNALMGSSEHGFPTHRNMNAPEAGSQPDLVVRANTRQSRNTPNGALLAKDGAPRALTKASGGDSLACSSASSSTRTSASLASTASRDSGSSNSSPELKFYGANINALVQQQQKLFEELDKKSRLIEKLQREKRVHEMREAEFRHNKSGLDTIRKPMAVANCMHNERKLVNNTLL